MSDNWKIFKWHAVGAIETQTNSASAGVECSVYRSTVFTQNVTSFQHQRSQLMEPRNSTHWVGESFYRLDSKSSIIRAQRLVDIMNPYIRAGKHQAPKPSPIAHDYILYNTPPYLTITPEFAAQQCFWPQRIMYINEISLHRHAYRNKSRIPIPQLLQKQLWHLPYYLTFHCFFIDFPHFHVFHVIGVPNQPNQNHPVAGEAYSREEHGRIRAQIVRTVPRLSCRIERVSRAGGLLRHEHLTIIYCYWEPGGGSRVLEGGRHGLARVPRPGLDVVDLHGERIVLKVAASAGDDDARTDHGDDGVGAPHKRGLGVVPGEVERIVGEGKLGGWKHVEEGRVGGAEGRYVPDRRLLEVEPELGTRVIGVGSGDIGRASGLSVNHQPGLQPVEMRERRGNGMLPWIGDEAGVRQINQRHVREYELQYVSIDGSFFFHLCLSSHSLSLQFPQVLPHLVSGEAVGVGGYIYRG